MKSILMILLWISPLAAQTLPVLHVKALWPDERGQIEITDTGIAYRPDDGKTARFWKFEDIQSLDRLGPREFVLLSYDDERLLLGRDKEYRFRILAGELSDELFQRIAARIGKPVTDRVVPGSSGSVYEVPAKHLHTFGGCEGTLRFDDRTIAYVTADRKDAREWRLDRDVESVWALDRYRLEIWAYETNRREFGQTRVFRFELKRALDPEFYRRLKLRLYDLQSAELPIQ
jgi:hypothetical protein